MKARALLRLYPRAWRERYGREVEALLAQGPETWRTRGDLIIGALHEWVSPRGWWTVRRAVRTFGMVWVFLPWLAGILIAQVGLLLGTALAAAGVAVPAGVLVVVFIAELAGFARGTAAVWSSSRMALGIAGVSRRMPLVGRRELMVWAAVLLGAATIAATVSAAGARSVPAASLVWHVSPLVLLGMGSTRAIRLGRLAMHLARRDRRVRIRRGLTPFLTL